MSKPETYERIDRKLALDVVGVEGSDALALLQALLSADLGTLPEATLRPAALCNPKGRVQQVLLAGFSDGCWQIFVPRPCAADLHARLRLMRIGREVELSTPRPAAPAAPQAGLRLEFDPKRALAPADNSEAVLPAEWLRADIEAGMPWILPAAAGRFLPQMLDLEALNGLSYRKGCFPGQEVIARVHYRGRVTSRLARFRFAADQAPGPGEQFELADDHGTATVLYTDVPASPAPLRGFGLAVVPADAPPDAPLTGGVAGRLETIAGITAGT